MYFISSWKTDHQCPNAREQLSHPCDVNTKFRKEAEEKCAVLKKDLFKNCHKHVSPEQAYKDCLFDMCSCEESHHNCLCPIIATYADQCADNEVVVDWRHQVRECGLHCPSGQEYRQCGNAYNYSCEAITLASNFTSNCVEGCQCPKGEALDRNGNCIQVSKCPCIWEETYYEPESVNFRPESGQLCTCQDAAWICHAASKEEETDNTPSLKCESALHRTLDNCPNETITCSNMHFGNKSPKKCVPRCVCSPGYVENEYGDCITFKECPCHHGYRSYQENDIIKQKCNTW